MMGSRVGRGGGNHKWPSANAKNNFFGATLLTGRKIAKERQVEFAPHFTAHTVTRHTSYFKVRVYVCVCEVGEMLCVSARARTQNAFSKNENFVCARARRHTQHFCHSTHTHART